MSAVDLRILESTASRAAAAGDGAASDPFRDAWRQLHYAAQAASEVAKSWGEPRSDDSHSNFGWEGTALVGVRVRGPRPFRAVLDVPTLALSLRDDGGEALASLPLDGTTLAAALAWSRARAAELAGEPARQTSVPAPDLPPHPIADGAAFAFGDRARFAALAALLGGAAGFLGVLARELAAADPPRIWPHHFDLAVLAALTPDRTIGVGLAPPDAIAPSGYWYVSPWSARAVAGPVGGWPALAHGRWVDRGGAPPIGTFALADWSALPSAAARAGALARFTAEAVAASGSALGA